MNEFFKYENLKKFLIFIRDRYPILSFNDQDSKNGILLRHDIDYSVEKAYSMALIEKMHGITSSFHVMISAYTYNVFSEENRRMLAKMAILGFEIGLHFNPAIYRVDELDKVVEAEVNALQFIVNKSVNCISIHNLHAYGGIDLFDNYVNIRPTGIFLADSRRTFRGIDPYEFVKQAGHNVIQLVLHPCYYTNDEGSYE